MKKLSISIIVFIVASILICSCTTETDCGQFSNLVIKNECSQLDIMSIGIAYGSQSGGAQNADNTPMKKGASVSFDMGEAQGRSFIITVSDKDWNVLVQDEFVKDFTYNADDIVYLSIRDAGDRGIALEDKLN